MKRSEEDVFRPRPDEREGLPMWAPPTDTIEKRREAGAARKAEIRRLIERSVPIAQRLAGLAKAHGIAPVDLEPHLKAAGILTGAEQDRSTSWICHVWKAAGLPKKWPAERRYNPRNGNYGDVHVAPEYLRADAPSRRAS